MPGDQQVYISRGVETCGWAGQEVLSYFLKNVGATHIAKVSGCENIRHAIFAPTDPKGLADPTGGHPAEIGSAPFE